ncbi:MAG: HNH endonuclease [Rhodobacteraceae bacterium]|nr:HNH endonuclease [Paracoccaceae bacterium]
MKAHPKYSKRVTSKAAWQAVRHHVLERDGWACTECGSRRRLEVHHVKPVRTHPELGFDPSNCVCLCVSCHTRATRIECGHPPPDPKRAAWREAVAELATKPSSNRSSRCLIA